MKFSLALLATVVTATQWHKCGSKPAKAWNGRSVKCSGDTCYSVCKKGWKPEGRAQIKCVSDGNGGYAWSTSNGFSQCTTCDTVDESQLSTGVFMKTVIRDKLPKMKFFCGDGLDTFNFTDGVYKGKNYRNVKCICKKGQNGDPLWKTSCSWEHRDLPFTAANAYAATCVTNQPDNTQRDLDNGDLDLANNQDSLDQNA